MSYYIGDPLHYFVRLYYFLTSTQLMARKFHGVVLMYRLLFLLLRLAP
jgi:hypothetical protein